MIKNDNITFFIENNYTPFKTTQCLKRLFLLWISSITMCFLGQNSNIYIILMTIFANLCVSFFFIYIILKLRKSQLARFYCDAFTYLYISLLSNVLSYKLLAMQIKVNYIWAIIFIILLFLNIAIFVIISYSKINSGKYSNEKSMINKSQLSIIVGTAGLLGLFFSRFFFQSIEKNTSVVIVSFLFLLISLLISIVPSINFLKIILVKKSK